MPHIEYFYYYGDYVTTDELLHSGDQWVQVEDNELILIITHFDNRFILNAYTEGIHYVDDHSYYFSFPQTTIELCSDTYQPLIIIPYYGGTDVTLPDSAWSFNSISAFANLSS